MATTYIVTVGTNAYSFNDQVTGISIAKEKRENLLPVSTEQNVFRKL